MYFVHSSLHRHPAFAYFTFQQQWSLPGLDQRSRRSATIGRTRVSDQEDVNGASYAVHKFLPYQITRSSTSRTSSRTPRQDITSQHHPTRQAPSRPHTFGRHKPQKMSSSGATVVAFWPQPGLPWNER